MTSLSLCCQSQPCVRGRLITPTLPRTVFPIDSLTPAEERDENRLISQQLKQQEAQEEQEEQRLQRKQLRKKEREEQVGRSEAAAQVRAYIQQEERKELITSNREAARVRKQARMAIPTPAHPSHVSAVSGSSSSAAPVGTLPSTEEPRLVHDTMD